MRQNRMRLVQLGEFSKVSYGWGKEEEAEEEDREMSAMVKKRGLPLLQSVSARGWLVSLPTSYAIMKIDEGDY